MSLARTRIAARLIAVAALAALTAGCFQPMYAERNRRHARPARKADGRGSPAGRQAQRLPRSRHRVEIRNALAFKLYGNATGMPPTHRLVLRFNTSRSSLMLDPDHRAAVQRELRHRRAVQSDRHRHQQVGHDRHDLLPRVLRHAGPSTSASPAHARLPRRRGSRRPRDRRKTSRPGWRRSSPPAPDPALGRAPRKRDRQLSRPAGCRPPHHPALRSGRRPGPRARRRADGARRSTIPTIRSRWCASMATSSSAEPSRLVDEAP